MTASATFMLLICGVINGFQFQNVISEIRDQVKQTSAMNAGSVADAIEAQYYERYGDVQAFAMNPYLHNNDPKVISKTLDQYANAYGIYDLIVVSDLNGKIISTNTHSPDGKALSFKNFENPKLNEQDWFQKVVKGEFTSDSDQELVGTFVTAPKFESWIEKLYGEPRHTNVFATLIKDEKGKPFRVIANFTNFKWLEGELANMSHTFMKHDSSFSHMKTYVLDHDGVLLAQYDSSEKEEKRILTDAQKLGNLNFATMNYGPTSSLLKGESGSDHFKGKGFDAYFSFEPLAGKKFTKKLGWGVLLELPNEDVVGDTRSLVYFFYGMLIISIFSLSLFAFFYYKKIGQFLTQRVDSFSKSSKVFHENAANLLRSSGELSEASSEQASAIQESVSALAEISSMISQTNENTKLSLSSTTSIVERSVAGREVMKKLGHSMESIAEANSSLQEIAEIISSINQKTSVINEIVFKTQLLSFNASIEAARAGQYGKGFAVVAEEVGNLAQMSGDAAREIEVLITNSEKKVDSTLGLIQRRVKEGGLVSAEALNAFNGISTAIEEIKNQVKAIADATVQQDVGIVQTQKAMTLLDEAARKTCNLSNEMKDSSHTLDEASDQLSLHTHDVYTMVHGTKSKAVSVETSLHSPVAVEPDLNSSEDLKLAVSSEINADDSSFTNAA